MKIYQKTWVHYVCGWLLVLHLFLSECTQDGWDTDYILTVLSEIASSGRWADISGVTFPGNLTSAVDFNPWVKDSDAQSACELIDPVLKKTKTERDKRLHHHSAPHYLSESTLYSVQMVICAWILQQNTAKSLCSPFGRAIQFSSDVYHQCYAQMIPKCTVNSSKQVLSTNTDWAGSE